MENENDKDNFKLRRLSAMVLLGICSLYVYSGSNDQNLTIIMLALAGFLVGASILQIKK